MGLTKQRKAYLAVLGAAGLFLALDRFVLDSGVTGPAAAEAAPQAAAAGEAKPAPKPRGDAGSASLVAARLQKAGAQLDKAPAVDAFAGTPLWLTSRLQPTAKAPDRNEIAEFTAAHELSTVIQARTENSGGGVAVVDGKPVYVGKKISDFTLIEVDAQKGIAVFEKDGKRAVLKMPGGAETRDGAEKSPR